eukprot:s5635_g10.t1
MSESEPSEQDALLVKPDFALSWDLWLLVGIPTAKLAACAGSVKLGAIPGVDVNLMVGLQLLLYGAYSCTCHASLDKSCRVAVRTAAAALLSGSACYITCFVQSSLLKTHIPPGFPHALCAAIALPLTILVFGLLCQTAPMAFWASLISGAMWLLGIWQHDRSYVVASFLFMALGIWHLEGLKHVERRVLRSADSVWHRGAASRALWRVAATDQGPLAGKARSRIDGQLTSHERRLARTL